MTLSDVGVRGVVVDGVSLTTKEERKALIRL